jgi:hypothetical protein
MDYRMDNMEEPRVKMPNVETASKTVSAVLTWLGTFAAEGIAAAAEANLWIHGALLAVGGAVNAFAVYWTQNKPKAPQF